MASESNIARYAALLILGIVVSVLYLPQFSEKAVLTLFPDVPSVTSLKNATKDVDGTKTEDSTVNVSSSSLERQPIKFWTTETGNMNKPGMEVDPTANMEPNGNNPNFPTRNNSDLSFRLAGIRKNYGTIYK